MTSDIVLLVTTSYDAGPEYVGQALARRGVSYFRLNTDEFPTQIQARFIPPDDLVVSHGTRSISSKQIKAVWYRRRVSPSLPEALDPGTRDFCERESRAFLDGVLSALPVGRWLSSPQAIAQAELKPYQLAVASEIGFTLPQTVITNQEESVHELARTYRLIAKAVSSGYVSTPDGNRAIFTNELGPDDLRDLGGLFLSPVIFQELVEKVSDIRVTVVDRDVFAAEIMSQDRPKSRVDWRATDDPHLEHRKHDIPIELADQCRELVSKLGLVFGAIDLALMPDGTYTFFEINPNGEWLWLEDQLGFPISDRIATWLDV